MTDLKMTIGNRVHNLRTSHNLTQAQFAEIIDISINFLSEIENGKKGMSQDTLYKLCSNFAVSADYILFGIEKDNTLSSDTIIEYVNQLNADELNILSNYLISLQALRKNMT